MLGLIFQKNLGNLQIIINGENILDVRQTKYDPLILGNPWSGPVRALPVWGPIEGRTWNLALRLSL